MQQSSQKQYYKNLKKKEEPQNHTAPNLKVFSKKLRKFGGLGFANITANSGKVQIDKNKFQDPNWKRHDEFALHGVVLMSQTCILMLLLLAAVMLVVKLLLLLPEWVLKLHYLLTTQIQ